MNQSLTAYKTVCKHCGIKPTTIKETFETKGDATLVIVPNKVFDWDQLKKLAVTFGKDQPRSTWSYDKLYQEYTSEELSGTPQGSKAYRAVYIPKECNVVAEPVPDQLEKHKNDYVPSVLDAICLWFTLRELKTELNYTSTYIRHFNLPAKRVDDWASVPYSCVYVGGVPYLDYSVADGGDGARVAVGQNLVLAASPLPDRLSIDNRVYVAEDAL